MRVKFYGEIQSVAVPCLAADLDGFEPVYSSVDQTVLSPNGPLRLVLASIGSVTLIVPVSWVYFMTGRARRIDQTFLQTIMILPVVVTGIAMIVLNSLALAFSLVGIVAAVRFRFTLPLPSDAMFIFVAIGIGLGSGIGALGIAAVIFFAFVAMTLGSPLGDSGIPKRLVGATKKSIARYPTNVVIWHNVSAEDDYACHDKTPADDFKKMIRERIVSAVLDY